MDTKFTGIELIVILGLLIATFVGSYLLADGIPEVIHITDMEKQTVVIQQEKICKDQVKELTNEIKDLKESRDKAFSLMKEHFEQYEQLNNTITNIDLNPEFKFTVQIHDTNINDYNECDINISY